MAVFVIAECGSSWRFGNDHLSNAYRMIEAAKSCGADAVKFQWCSSAKELATRRGEPQYEKDYEYVVYDREWLPMLKEKADKVGIEWICTAFLPQDVSVIAPLVKRFKVARKEANDDALREAIEGVNAGRQVIVSATNADQHCWGIFHSPTLRCVSKYPCPLEELSLRGWGGCPGLSDHTGHVLTGAVAVGAGAKVIEAHIKHYYTPKENPDFPHSLYAWLPPDPNEGGIISPFQTYVQNIRTAERML